jgi:hypothetical protein
MRPIGKKFVAAGLRGVICAGSVAIVFAAYSWTFVTALASN